MQKDFKTQPKTTDMKKIRGKFLIRKIYNSENEPLLIITGVSFATNIDLNTITDDELWVADIHIQDNGIKFTEPRGHTTPEHFLEGKGSYLAFGK